MSTQDYIESSGNLFKDFGWETAEAEMMQAKLGMITSIKAIIEKRGMTQTKAAKMFGIKQPALSRILSGEFESITFDTLFKYSLILDRSINITLEKSPNPHLQLAA